jgi:uncharacterized membrane protein YuzA (DUF378 family)
MIERNIGYIIVGVFAVLALAFLICFLEEKREYERLMGQCMAKYTEYECVAMLRGTL